jgi:hypothetical protein
MTAEKLVDHLLEAEFGPPMPDNFMHAIGSMDDLMSLERQKLATMAKLKPSLGLERQLRKAGITREQVARFIRADQAYPEKYPRFPKIEMVPVPGMDGEFRRRKVNPPWPADTIVGMETNDGQKIMFDLPIIMSEQ